MSAESPSAPLRIAAVADVHVTARDAGDLPDILGEAGREADVLVIAGDLTDHGLPEEAEMLARVLRGSRIPVVAVLGNHDHESDRTGEVSAVLKEAGVKLLDGEACSFGGVGFVGVKGFAGGFGARMLGSFGEPAIKSFVGEGVGEALKLENALRKAPAGRTLVILHYAPIAETVEGEPLEIYPFLGSSRLAETIDRFAVDAVVHGHAHRGRHLGRTPGGTPVYNVAAAVEKPDGRRFALIEL
jgi:Icc-related predicted phosphoesterase